MRTRILFSTILLTVVAFGVLTAGDWTQWGGPAQDFQSDSPKLAAEWPESGPKQLWSRELGAGYSGILIEDGKLYTMYRVDDQEAVVVLDAKTGKTIWEQRYDSSPEEGHVTQYGEGPRATPLIVGDRLYAIGVAGRMHCLKKSDGSVIWSQDLWGEELGGNVLQHGYSSSPVFYKNTVIVLVGGEGASVVALDAKNGKIKWKALDFKNSYSTPRLLDVDGEQQIVAFMDKEMIGVDPSNGDLKWSFPHDGANVSMPVMADKNHLFLSSPGAGAKGLKLTNRDGKTEVEEVWSTRKINFYHVTSVLQGDWVYGSTGTRAPAFMAAVNIRTGEIAWRERGYGKANVVAADGKLIILDEDGQLCLTTASPEGLTLHSRTKILEPVTWTVPTIVGKTMYVRDSKSILALDLG